VKARPWDGLASKADLYVLQDGFDCFSRPLRLAQEIRQPEASIYGSDPDECEEEHDLAGRHLTPIRFDFADSVRNGPVVPASILVSSGNVGWLWAAIFFL
jgi:hypothetical protein